MGYGKRKALEPFCYLFHLGKPWLTTEQRPGSCTVWVNLLFYSLDVFSTPFSYLFPFVCLF